MTEKRFSFIEEDNCFIFSNKDQCIYKLNIESRYLSDRKSENIKDLSSTIVQLVEELPN